MDSRLISHINWSLVAFTVILFFLGLINLYSASGTRLEDGMAYSNFYQRQLVWGIAGLGCMLVTMVFDYRRLRNFAWPFFFIAIFCLLLVPVIGKTVYGAKRWLSLGLFSFQPSEMAKLAVLILTARILSSGSRALSWKDFFAVLAIGLIPSALIITQPDLGTTLMLLLIMGGMMLFHGLQMYVFKTCMLACPVIGTLMWCVGMRDYQRQRVLSFLNPGDDPRGAGYHLLQSRIAIGSGQLWGKGLEEGTQSQLRFLPERHTDFALAVYAEEWGFIGCVALISLYCLFLMSIITTVVQAKDRFGSMLGVGIFFYFFWQILINIAMVVGLLPVVGIPLPFISYGGTATIINFILLGLVMNVSMRRFMFKG